MNFDTFVISLDRQECDLLRNALYYRNKREAVENAKAYELNSQEKEWAAKDKIQAIKFLRARFYPAPDLFTAKEVVEQYLNSLKK